MVYPGSIGKAAAAAAAAVQCHRGFPLPFAPVPHCVLGERAVVRRGTVLTCHALCIQTACRANTDPVLYYQTQDKWIREYWVHVEYMKMLKDEVRNCYRREGVNHYENCRDLVHEYYARTKAPMYSLKGPK